MKFNLKNRPDPHFYDVKSCKDMHNWFEGFEKELREILRTDRQVGYDLFPTEGEKKLAREILGD